MKVYIVVIEEKNDMDVFDSYFKANEARNILIEDGYNESRVYIVEKEVE